MLLSQRVKIKPQTKSLVEKMLIPENTYSEGDVNLDLDKTVVDKVMVINFNLLINVQISVPAIKMVIYQLFFRILNNN